MVLCNLSMEGHLKLRLQSLYIYLGLKSGRFLKLKRDFLLAVGFISFSVLISSEISSGDIVASSSEGRIDTSVVPNSVSALSINTVGAGVSLEMVSILDIEVSLGRVSTLDIEVSLGIFSNETLDNVVSLGVGSVVKAERRSWKFETPEPNITNLDF